ncbi:MAG: expansin EXLX1 family cellulose-binding protein [Xenococcaceae cyanobacterium]
MVFISSNSKSTNNFWEYLGFNYTSWWNGKFAARESTKALQQIAETGSDTATIVTTNYVTNTQSSKIFAQEQKTESLTNVEKAIVDAKNQELSVWLKPHIDPQDGQWRGFLNPTDRTTFFNNYKAFMLDYAKLAQAQGVEVLVIGTEIDQLIDTADKDYWLDLIAEVRQVYDGKLTYAVNWDKADRVSFAEALDFVGIDAYYPLTENKNATVEELVKAWTDTPETDAVTGITNGRSIVDWLRQVSTDYGKPLVFTEIGFRSLDGNAAKPYEFNGGGQVDFEEQARLYEAFFKVFGGQTPEAGNLDWFKGAQFWNWYATEAQNNDPTDLDYPILGKPAEVIFKEYSSKLLSGSPNPVEPVDPVDPTIPTNNSAVDFAITNSWGGGYQGQVEITNQDSSQLNSWTLEFEFAGQIEQIWNAEIVSQTGNTYVISNSAYNGTIASGDKVSFGFTGEGSVPNLPNVFELNEKVVGETPTTPTDPTDPIPTPNPTQSGSEWLEIDRTYTGKGTYYGATGAGNAGYDVVELDQRGRIAAINRQQWNNSEASGAFFEVSGPYQREGNAEPIDIMIVDQLPDRDNGLDLSAEAFAGVADPVTGVVELEYNLISPADDFVTPYGNRIGDGIIVDRLAESNPYWPAVRLINHRNPVQSLALVTDDGQTLPMERQSNNIFVLEQGIGQPLTGDRDFISTDIFGQKVVLNDIDITGGTGEDITTGQQFPITG